MTTILLFTFTHEILFHSFNQKNPETTKYTKVHVYRTHLIFVVYKKYFLSFHRCGEYTLTRVVNLCSITRLGLKQVLIQSLATLLTRSFYRYRPIYIFCIFLFWKTRRNVLALTDIIMQVYRVSKG